MLESRTRALLIVTILIILGLVFMARGRSRSIGEATSTSLMPIAAMELFSGIETRSEKQVQTALSGSVGSQKGVLEAAGKACAMAFWDSISVIEQVGLFSCRVIQ